MRRALVVIYETLKLLIGAAIALIIFTAVLSASAVLIVELTKKPLARWVGTEFANEDLYFAIVGIVSLVIAGIFLLGIVQLISLLKKGREQ